ncbi:hypothetical protein WR25_26885 [Diploscapter pachys]|uniref:SGF29 C-terminal domain-containing protein n=1 Tax=Diploscapter pachys TaxID=2018661 RepID=A0A2A2J751_9BILA|nr:hypothetical protein WR25_26885 [Diploscapter pachys]
MQDFPQLCFSGKLQRVQFQRIVRCVHVSTHRSRQPRQLVPPPFLSDLPAHHPTLMLQSIQSLSLHAPPPLTPFPSLNALLPPPLVLIALRKNSIERFEDSDEETTQPDSEEEMPRKKEESSAEKRVDNQQELVKKLPLVKHKVDRVNENLEALGSFVEKNAPVGKNKQKALGMYQNLLRACESDVDYIKKLLSQIERIRRSEYDSKMKTNMKRSALMQLIAVQAKTLPLYVSGIEGHPPPGVGGISIADNVALRVGDAVAAHTGSDWILAEIASVTDKGRYEVRDVDDEKRRNKTIPRQRLIPLPKYRADPQRDPHALFPSEALVLALYPQTTCFYKGVVSTPPKTPTSDYMVMFDDPSYPSGYSPALPIPQRYVIPFREISTIAADRDE